MECLINIRHFAKCWKYQEVPTSIQLTLVEKRHSYTNNYSKIH